jgi:predicted S18 family serine protease
MADNDKPKADRIIQHVGRDYVEHVEGDYYSGASGQAQQQINAQQLADSLTSNSSKEDVQKLLQLIREEIAKSQLPEDVKEETLAEIQTAEVQAKKEEPDKEKLATKLKNATEALEGSSKTFEAAVKIGNMIGKAILWCGAQWIAWKYGG